MWISSHISFFRVSICCIFSSLSSVCLLTKEHSSFRVCSRSNIAGADLTFDMKSFIGATLEHSLCEVREHLIQHERYGQDRTNRVSHHDLRNDNSKLRQQLVNLCSPLMILLYVFWMILKIYVVLDNRNTKNHHNRNTKLPL